MTRMTKDEYAKAMLDELERASKEKLAREMFREVAMHVEDVSYRELADECIEASEAFHAAAKVAFPLDISGGVVGVEKDLN